MDLYAPVSFINAPISHKMSVCNGAGPAGTIFFGWIQKAKLVPDTIYGLRITGAANIHDWMYFKATCLIDKFIADRVFFINLRRLVDDKGGWLHSARMRRVRTYYAAVLNAGASAFWSGKKHPDDDLKALFGDRGAEGLQCIGASLTIW